MGSVSTRAAPKSNVKKSQRSKQVFFEVAAIPVPALSGSVPTVLRYRNDHPSNGRDKTCRVPRGSVVPYQANYQCSRVAESELTRHESRETYLDYPANFEIDNQRALAAAFGHGTHGENNARVYFHVARSPNQHHIAIQYWFFYSYNFFEISETLAKAPFVGRLRVHGFANTHEGDWEHVTVHFVGDKLATARPVQVFYSAHGKSSRTRDWGTSSDFRKGIQDELGDPNRLRTYPAWGSHANLPYCGDDFKTDVSVTIDPPELPKLTKTINDHVCSEGKVSNAYTIRPQQAALDNLDTHEWACWRGVSGAPNWEKASPEDDKLINLFGAEPGEPRMPLTSYQQGGQAAPSCVGPPGSASARGGPGQTLESTEVSSAPFEEFSECGNYERPGDTPGLTVVACDPEKLRSSLLGEGSPAPLTASRTAGGEQQSTFPLVVTGLAPDQDPELEALHSSHEMRVYVARTPDDGGDPLVVRFPEVAVDAGDRLRVDASAPTWRLLDGSGRTLAVARPRSSVRSASTPRLRSVSWSRTGSTVRARFVVEPRGAREVVSLEAADGRGRVRRLGRTLLVRDRRRRALSARLPAGAIKVRLVARGDATQVRSRWKAVR